MIPGRVQGSPSGCGRLEIRGVSQVEKGEHRRSFVYECCGVDMCCTAAEAAAVVRLLYCADAFGIQRTCVEIVPRCVQDNTPT